MKTVQPVVKYLKCFHIDLDSIDNFFKSLSNIRQSTAWLRFNDVQSLCLPHATQQAVQLSSQWQICMCLNKCHTTRMHTELNMRRREIEGKCMCMCAFLNLYKNNIGLSQDINSFHKDQFVVLKSQSYLLLQKKNDNHKWPFLHSEALCFFLVCDLCWKV